MAALAIRLFGHPQLELDGAPILVEERKALALLAYLAAGATPQPRELLAELLWADQAPGKALANLRHALWSLRRAGLDPWFQGDRTTLGLRPGVWVDVAAFEQALQDDRLDAAVDLARGEFLAGLAIRDAAGFEQWQLREAERLRQLLAAALAQLADRASIAGAYDQALAHAQNRLGLDPLHEAAHRQLMRIYALSGQRAAAVRQYEECARLIAAELGAEPEPETLALLEQIRRGALAAGSALHVPAPLSPAAGRPDLPHPTTSFVGREAELAELEPLLLQPACRLLTLLGPGGSGKTRLAIALAERVRSRFPDGVTFVSLQGLTTAAQIPSALAEALALPLHGAEPPWAQLIGALRARSQLLIFDNIEHLLEGGSALAALVAAAPRLTLLVTSREPLKLQEEWLFPLDGLALPPELPADDTPPSSAVRLFVERALQVRPAFSLAAEQAAVAQICRLVAGMPLAIELAAAWVRTLSCAEIAAELADNLALLATDVHNVPVRHRSMRAVFDQTWARLEPATRAVLMRLAVFRSSFTREAAAQVAGATLPALAQLTELALLRRDPNGRYQLHELLRQDVAQRMAGALEVAAEVETAYGRYYGAFLLAQFGALTEGRQREAIRALADELENLRHAWPILVAQQRAAELFRMAHALDTYYFFCGPYQEGIDLLALAIARLEGSAAPADCQVLAVMLNDLGLFKIRVGRLLEAEEHLSASAAILAREGSPPLPGISTDPAVGLAILALIRGDYGAASQLADAVRARSEQHGLVGNLPYAWYLHTEAALAQGLHQAAQRSAHQALLAAEAAGDDWFRAYILNQLGQVSAALGQEAEAEQQFTQSYRLREAFNDPQGMAVALLNRGALALQRGNASAAAELYLRSRAIAERIGDRGGEASALVGLGAVATVCGDAAEASRAFRAALEIAVAMDYLHVLLSLVTRVGGLQLAAGQPALAAELLTFVLRDPASTREISQLAQQLLLRCEAELAPAALAEAAQRGQRATRDGLVAQLRAVLLRPLERAAPSAEAAAARVVAGGQDAPNAALPEPLSERELSILAAIAEGLSNQAIADRLFLSLGTVKWYTGQIYGKLGVQTRTQAIAQARALLILP